MNIMSDLGEKLCAFLLIILPPLERSVTLETTSPIHTSTHLVLGVPTPSLD